MKTQIHLFCLVAVLLTGPQFSLLRAQLVPDGATATINGTSTNITGLLVIGTNGSFTTLIITNAGTVTNTGNGIIGQNFSANTNQVIVTDAGSSWNIGGSLNFGVLGSYGLLIVTNGGRVEDNSANIPLNGGSANTAIVTGTNSVWTNRSGLNVGQVGEFHRLFVTNGGIVGSGAQLNVGNIALSNQLIVAGGGKVFSGNIRLGFTFSSLGNLAVIAGASSECRVGSEVDVGYDSSFNQLFLTNGAKIFSGGTYVGASFAQGSSGNSNLVVIAGAGSAWTNSSGSGVGDNGSRSQLIITNGGVLRHTTGGSLRVGTRATGSNNLVMISGANSLFSSPGDTLTGRMSIGYLGSFNQLLLRDGGVAEAETGALGDSGLSSNNLAVVVDPGSRWVSQFALYVGNTGPFNTLVVSNGGSVAAGNLFIGSTDTSSNNAATVAGGSLIVSNQTGSASADVRRGTLTLDAGLLYTDRLLLTNGPQGQLIFNGGTLQTRNTTISNGMVFLVGTGSSPATLELLGSGVHAFSSQLYIANEALLKGNGTISGTLILTGGSTLSPGTSIGKIVLNSPPVLAGNALMEISKNGATLTNDQIQVSALLTYGGSLIVSNLGPTALALGDRFPLFSANSYTGAFEVVSLPPLNSGLGWTNKLLVDGSLEVVGVTLPKFASITVSGTNVILSGTNGLAGANYAVLTATNITIPPSNWVSLVTNQFGSGGQFSFTNGIAPGDPQRYFRIRTP